MEPRDAVHECGLAGSVLTDEPDHLTGTHLQVHMAEGLHAAEGLGYVAAHQDRFALVDRDVLVRDGLEGRQVDRSQ
ncbi:MAG: hypothetical protein M9942_00095 [Microthrixaceae bacterium]|nr:hypothetical protein [Microthrixaceae bacterium]